MFKKGDFTAVVLLKKTSANHTNPKENQALTQESNPKHKQQKWQTPKLKTEWILLYLEDVSTFAASDVLLARSFGKYQKVPTRWALDCLYFIADWFRSRIWFCSWRWFGSSGWLRSWSWFGSGFWLCSRCRFCSSVRFPFASLNVCQLIHLIGNSKTSALLCLPNRRLE